MFPRPYLIRLTLFAIFFLSTICFVGVAGQEVVSTDTLYVTATDTLSSVIIDTIRVRGNKKTKEHIVRREFFFREGDSLSIAELAKKIEDTRNYLMNTALFVEVIVSVQRLGQQRISIVVDLKERWYIFPLPYFKIVDRNFNQWWVESKRSFSRVNYGLKFMWHNFSGRRDNLYVYLITGYNRQVELKYEHPFVDKSLKHGMGFMFKYGNQKETPYMTALNKQVFLKQDKFLKEDLRIELDYYYRPAIKSRHTVRLSYNKTQIDDSISRLNPKYLDGRTSISYPELAYVYQYFGADYLPYPTKGFLAKLELIRRGFRSDVGMWQFNTRMQYTQPVLAKTQLQFELNAALKLPFDQPYYNQQLFGYGEMYLRGQEYYVIDGVAGAVGKSTLQTQVLNFTINNPYKIRSLEKIPFRFVMKIYGDLGYAYTKNAGNNMLNNKLLRSWGVGLDIITIYDMVLKIEYSFNQLGDRGLFLHSKNEF